MNIDEDLLTTTATATKEATFTIDDLHKAIDMLDPVCQYMMKEGCPPCDGWKIYAQADVYDNQEFIRRSRHSVRSQILEKDQIIFVNEKMIKDNLFRNMNFLWTEEAQSIPIKKKIPSGVVIFDESVT